MATPAQKQTFLAYDSNRSDTLYTLTDTTLSPVPVDTFKGKADVSVGLISEKEIISYSFDVDKGLAAEELADTVEIRMFQDAGLNHMIDYTIAFAARDSLLDAKRLSVTAFAVTKTQFAAEFGPLLGHCSYIDTILPHATLPHALYAGEILEPGSDIFIYYREKETMFSLFHEGNFVYSKNIGGGLKGLYDLFVRNNNESVAYDAYLSALIGQGLDPERYGPDPDVYLQDIADVLERNLGELGNVIQYARRIAGLQTFDRIFIGSERGNIPGLTDLVVKVTGIRGEVFEFFTPFYDTESPYRDQNAILALIEAENIRQGHAPNPFNLSIYPRPPRFHKRESGRLLLVTAASLLMAAAYPLYLSVDTHWKEYAYTKTLSRLQISQGEFMQLKAEEDAHKSRKKHYQELLAGEKEALEKQIALFKAIETKRLAANTKTHTLARLFTDINRHRLRLEQVDVEANRYRLALQASKDDDVTAFLKSVTAQERFTVDMHTYAYNPVIGRYQTLISVEVTP